jgi:deoxyribodipyrimidine photolyase-like uncharacterized protein
VSAFGDRLRGRNPDPAGRSWLFVPYDQLRNGVGPLSREDPEELGIVLVETGWRLVRRPYHEQKLALASQRHFALEQAARGVPVRYIAGEASYATLLAPLAAGLGPLRAMQPAERELRADLAPYRAFLARHRDRLAENPRLAVPYRGLARRKPAQRRRDAETFERVSATLARGQGLAP